MGYINQSFSENHNYCLNSEEKFKRAEAVKFLKQKFGIKILAKDLNKYCRANEFHHSSKFFNETLWWDLEQLEAFGEENQGEDFRPEKKAQEELVEGTGYWKEWQGSKRRGRFVDVEAKGVLNKDKDIFYYGSELQFKKFRSGKHFYFSASKKD